MVQNIYQSAFKLYNDKQYEESIRLFDQSIKTNANNVGSHFYKGNALKSLKQFKKAIECYNKCIEIYPKYINAIVEKGFCQLEMGSQLEAKKTFEQVLLYDSTANRHQQLGLGFLYLGELDLAMKSFKMVIQLHPRPIEALLNVSFVYLILGKKVEAAESLQKILEFDNKNGLALTYIGYMQSVSQDFKQAFLNFNQAIENDRSLALAFIFRAHNYLSISNWQSALQDFITSQNLLEEEKQNFLTSDHILAIKEFVAYHIETENKITSIEGYLQTCNFTVQEINGATLFIKKSREILRVITGFNVEYLLFLGKMKEVLLSDNIYFMNSNSFKQCLQIYDDLIKITNNEKEQKQLQIYEIMKQKEPELENTLLLVKKNIQSKKKAKGNCSCSIF